LAYLATVYEEDVHKKLWRKRRFDLQQAEKLKGAREWKGTVLVALPLSVEIFQDKTPGIF
jgi:hypothetical protein